MYLFSDRKWQQGLLKFPETGQWIQAPEQRAGCVFYQGQDNGRFSPWSVISALGLQLLQLSPYLTQSNIFVQAVIFPQNLLVLVKGFMGNQLCLVFSDPERLLYIHTLSNKYGNADGLGHGGDKQKWWEIEIPKSPSPGSGFVKTASLVYRMFLHLSSKESWTSEWIYGLICFPCIIFVQLFFPL